MRFTTVQCSPTHPQSDHHIGRTHALSLSTILYNILLHREVPAVRTDA